MQFHLSILKYLFPVLLRTFLKVIAGTNQVKIFFSNSLTVLGVTMLFVVVFTMFLICFEFVTHIVWDKGSSVVFYYSYFWWLLLSTETTKYLFYMYFIILILRFFEDLTAVCWVFLCFMIFWWIAHFLWYFIWELYEDWLEEFFPPQNISICLCWVSNGASDPKGLQLTSRIGLFIPHTYGPQCPYYGQLCINSQ